MWRRVAVRLAREHDEAMVRFWIEQARLWGPDLRNRGGWIRCALDEGYRLPAPDPRTDPAEMRERLSQAVWAAMAPEDKARTLHEAKAENSEWCRKAREIASWCPTLRDGMNATIGVDYVLRHRLGAVS